MSAKYSISELTPDHHFPEIKTLRIDFFHGIALEMMTLGCTIRALEVPDMQGQRKNVVLNYKSTENYLHDSVYLGCIIGRFSNRIKNGKFKLNEEVFELSQNHGRHHLHGGYMGFNKKIWSIDLIRRGKDSVSLTLSCTSPDKEEGYPGTLNAKVTYVISAYSFKIIYEGTSSADTIFNPTSHSYFNLSGDVKNRIDDHWLKINASEMVSINTDLIPNGDFESVQGTHFDFSVPKKMGTQAYDNCYKLIGNILLEHKGSGRALEISTSFPGLQLYTADSLSDAGLINRTGLCLETQFFPDSPNHNHFPSTVLKKEAVFSHSTLYSFQKPRKNRKVASPR